MKRNIVLGLFWLIAISFEGQAQTHFTISGITSDSVTRDPVAIVYVQSLRTKNVSITNDKGEFKIISVFGDSLIFSRLGYRLKKVFIGTLSGSIAVTLSETQTILPALSIYGDYQPQGKPLWYKSIRIPKPTDNVTQDPGNEYMIQTFGPSYTIIGPFSYFLKSEKEKRTLKRVENERNRTHTFRMVMNDPETKSLIKNRFSFSQEKYDSRIEQFVLKYPDAAYLKSRIEILDLLFYFFSLKEFQPDSEGEKN